MKRAVIAILLFSCAAGYGQTPQLTPEEAAFRPQYLVLAQALISGDDAQIQAAAEDFRLPRLWMEQTFGRDATPQLARGYEDRFQEFLRRTRSRLLARRDGLPICGSIELRRHSTSVWIPAFEDVLVPKEALQRFESRCTPSGARMQEGKDSTWMDTCMFINGKFRYFGGGAHSFWEPEPVPSDACDSNHGQSGGKVISKVEAEYPADGNGAEGLVQMLGLLSPRGELVGIEYIQGPRPLVRAARTAFKQWRFTPFMSCGKPIYGKVPANFTFKAP